MPTIDFKDITADIAKRTAGVNAAMKSAAVRVGAYVREEAVKNAPRSPTQAESDEQRKIKKDGTKRTGAEMRKLNRTRKKLRKTLAKKRLEYNRNLLAKINEEAAKGIFRGNAKFKYATRHAPGGLEKSIASSVTGSGKSIAANIFVSGDAEKYARRIHDEKGKTWKERGRGTVNKGQRADDKFIERAVFNAPTNAKIKAVLADELAKVRAK